MGRLDPTEYVIGDAPQYFFDNGVVGAVANVTRTVHRPRKSPANPVIQADRPWEHITYFSFNGWQTWQDAHTAPRTACTRTGGWTATNWRVAKAAPFTLGPTRACAIATPTPTTARPGPSRPWAC